MTLTLSYDFARSPGNLPETANPKRKDNKCLQLNTCIR